MSVSTIAWKLDGCGDQCYPHRHDPFAHEAHGRLLEREAQQPRVIMSGPLLVDIDAHRFTVAGQEVYLTRTERDMLLALAVRAGRLVRNRELISAVWGPEFFSPGSNVLRVNISRLRARLGAAASLIVTVLNTGYRLETLPPDTTVLRREHPTRVLARWAKQWTQCQGCATTDRPHYARGRCDRCYHRMNRQEVRRP